MTAASEIVSSASPENFGTLISKAHFDCEVDFILSVESEGARPRIGREESVDDLSSFTQEKTIHVNLVCQ